MPDSLPGTFRVDAEQLGSLAGQLDECAADMKSAGYSMEQASVHDVGHAGLEERCGDFRDAWKYGIGQLSKLTDAIRDGLKKTADNYSATDRAISELFAVKGSSGGTAAPAGAPAQNRSMADDFG
ncbi:WXG100 family type VII secretion target [Streptomyces sp. NBC_01465]|uniref:WXG100 family type VII secretion target n=1 Tax=Streptomyces sp. NBC_01465 TaxID=2903878 RepID=UPI002E2EECDD|nr:type VII secretion target [Streptomyces sp. NBC_01465]